MKWTSITTEQELREVINNTEEICMIFKHSCRCGTSFMALESLEKEWNPPDMKHVKTYFIDVIEHRSLARSTAGLLGHPHQSPQILILKGGECIYENSHYGINYREIKNIIHGELLNQNT